MLIIYPTDDMPARAMSLVTDDYGFLVDLFEDQFWLCDPKPWNAAHAFIESE